MVITTDVGRRSGICARAAIDIGAIRCDGGRSCLGLGIGEAPRAARSGRTLKPQEELDAEEAALPELFSGLGAGMSSRLYQINPHLSQPQRSSLSSFSSCCS